MEDKFQAKLTQEEIDAEVSRLGDFFKQIPDDLKAETAVDIIFNAALWGSFELTHGLGVIEEAKCRFRETIIRVDNGE